MEQKKMTVAQWLEAATAGIRFGPDRKAAAAELREHIEDKAADFQRFFPDMTGEAAVDRAVSEMGDAAEIGKELAKIHKPWLGYLWRASQVLLWAAAVALAVLYWYDGIGSTLSLVDDRRCYRETVWASGEERRIGDVALPPDVEEGGYRFSFDELELWQGEEHRIVYGVLAVENSRLWEPLYDLEWNLWAEDDRGNRMPNFWTYARLSEVERREVGYVDSHEQYRGPARSRYEFRAELPDAGIGELVLRYDWMGADLAVPILLKEGQP